jgi:hypothetical protein
MVELKSFEECAVEARCGVSAVRAAVKRGELTAVRIGRRVWVSAASLRTFLSRAATTGERTPAMTETTR